MLDLGTFNTEVRANQTKMPVFARMALMFEKIQDAVNQLGTATGVDANSHLQPPPPPQAMSVKPANGLVHVTLTDSSQRSRALHYFVEHDTDPSFPNPHVVHLGAARGAFVTLPAKNDTGDAQPWYFRAYSMYLGSEKASDHVILGGAAAPTPVSVGGTTQLTPLPSTGAGTSSTNGQQGGKGFGTPQYARSSV